MLVPSASFCAHRSQIAVEGLEIAPLVLCTLVTEPTMARIAAAAAAIWSSRGLVISPAFPSGLAMALVWLLEAVVMPSSRSNAVVMALVWLLDLLCFWSIVGMCIGLTRMTPMIWTRGCCILCS